MDAFGLPKNTDAEKKARTEAIRSSIKIRHADSFQSDASFLQSMEVFKAMAETGNPNSVSDAGVGALCALTAVEGAYLNVKINAAGISDKAFTSDLLQKAEEIAQKAKAERDAIIAIVEDKINNL